MSSRGQNPTGFKRLSVLLAGVLVVTSCSVQDGEAVVTEPSPVSADTAQPPTPTTQPITTSTLEETEAQTSETDAGFTELPSPTARQILEEARTLRWEGWELESGVTDQTLYQFPSQGRRLAFTDQMREDVAAVGYPSQDAMLASLRYDMIDRNDGSFLAVGYFANLVVLVEGESTDAVRNALNIIDSEWCCGSTP